MGYLAFGPATQDIITFNLPQNWTTAAVKLSLCVGLFFTFSPMMIPVYQIVERGLTSKVSNQSVKSGAGRGCLIPAVPSAAVPLNVMRGWHPYAELAGHDQRHGDHVSHIDSCA